MLRVRPFHAIRPLPNLAARVASVPYDVVDRDEAVRLAEGNPHSFLHVIRSEIDLPPETDCYADDVYARAATNLQRLLSEGVLVREDKPCLYLYRLVMGDHSQVGLVCCCHIEDYEAGVIKKHERTRPDKEDDRTRHMLAIGAHPGPVLLTYRDVPALGPLFRHDMNSRPLFHFDASDGVTHTVWTVLEPDVYREAFASVPCAYVADGHHRIASAARAAAEWRRTGAGSVGEPAGNSEHDWFLAALFPAGELTILPYNRLVTGIGLDIADVVRRLGEVGRFTVTDDPRPPRPGTFCVYADGQWRRLELDAASIDRTDPVASLDVALLQDRVLQPILGVDDPRSDPRLSFVGGVRGTEQLQQRVDAEPGAIAFSLYPTSIEQLLTVADAGLFMPPKSTWFEPKLRSGLLVHEVRKKALAMSR